MGAENNNAILATTWDKKEISRIIEWIDDLGPDSRSLFLISPEVINGKKTIVLVPDGSKENWSESDAGDVLRNDFILELKKGDYEDGSSSWDFIEVGYGDYGQKVLQGNCTNKYNDMDYAC